MSLGLLALALDAPAACVAPPAPPTPRLALNAGVVELFDPHPAGRFGVEYRFPRSGPWKLVPSVGAAVSDSAAAFVYCDFRRDFWLHPNWAISPRAGLGAFIESEDLILGNTLEFRTGIELEYRLPNGHRIGVSFFHLSNAGISDTNPGTEAVVLFYSVPLPGRRSERTPGATRE